MVHIEPSFSWSSTKAFTSIIKFDTKVKSVDVTSTNRNWSVSIKIISSRITPSFPFTFRSVRITPVKFLINTTRIYT